MISNKMHRNAGAIATFALATSLGLAISTAPGLANPTVGGAPRFATKNIVENAMNSKDHTTLVAAVKAAGLVETLKGAKAYAPAGDNTLVVVMAKEGGMALESMPLP